MKTKYKKRNSPRYGNALKKVITELHKRIWHYFYAIRAEDIGTMALDIAYGADKYDVLSKVCRGFLRSIVTFIRGDIRNRHFNADYMRLLIRLSVLIVLYIITSAHNVITTYQ